MRNRTYGGVRGRKTKVGEKLLRFPPTRLMFYVICHLLTLYKVVDAILLFVGKDTIFPRNFQGFREKILEKGEEIISLLM